MLAGDDVVDLMGNETVVFGYKAILTAVISTLCNQHAYVIRQ